MARRPGRRRGGHSQTVRVLRLRDDLLSRRAPAALTALAAAHNVSERQLRRDLAILDELGCALDWTRIAGRAAVRARSRPRDAPFLTVRERYALIAARRVFDVLDGTTLAEDIRSIFDKLAASLPDAVPDLRGLADRIVYVPDGGIPLVTAKPAVLDGLLTGTLRRRRVDYRYRSAAGRIHRATLDPYAMALYRHDLYTVGRSTRWPDRVVVLLASRFLSATPHRTASFDAPEIDVQSLFDGAFGVHLGTTPIHVVLDFDRTVTPRVSSRTWHPTQTLRRTRRGCRMEMTLTNATAIVPWILAWGGHVEVVAPDEVADAVAAERSADAKRS